MGCDKKKGMDRAGFGSGVLVFRGEIDQILQK